MSDKPQSDDVVVETDSKSVQEADAKQDAVKAAKPAQPAQGSKDTKDPNVHEAGSKEDVALKADRPHVNEWEKAVEKIKANAAKNGGFYIANDPKTGKPFVDPSTGKPYEVNALLQKIHDSQVSGKGMDVPGAGINKEGNSFYFVPANEASAVPAPNKAETQKKEEDKKKEEGGWFSRNWKWLAAAAGALAVGAAVFFMSRKKKNKSTASTTTAKSTDSATTSTPAVDNTPANTPAPSPSPELGASGALSQAADRVPDVSTMPSVVEQQIVHSSRRGA